MQCPAWALAYKYANKVGLVPMLLRNKWSDITYLGDVHKQRRLNFGHFWPFTPTGIPLLIRLLEYIRPHLFYTLLSRRHLWMPPYLFNSEGFWIEGAWKKVACHHAYTKHQASRQLLLSIQKTEWIRRLLRLGIVVVSRAWNGLLFKNEDSRQTTATPGGGPSFIYSWSISHIFKHDFFCLGHFGQLRAVRKKTWVFLRYFWVRH